MKGVRGSSSFEVDEDLVRTESGNSTDMSLAEKQAREDEERLFRRFRVILGWGAVLLIPATIVFALCFICLSIEGKLGAMGDIGFASVMALSGAVLAICGSVVKGLFGNES